MREGVASRVEFSLITLLGVSLALTSFPFLVWRGFGVDLAHLTGGALVVVAAAGVVVRARPRPPGRLAFCAAGLLLVPLVPFFLHRLPGFSAAAFARSWPHLGFMVAVFLAVSSAQVSSRQINRLLATLAGAGAVEAIYGAWQSVAFVRGWPTGIDLLNRLASSPLRGSYPGFWRATGTLQEPRWLVIYLLTPAVCAFGLVVRRLEEGRRALAIAWAALLAAITAGVALTGSVGGIPSMGALLLAMLVVTVIRLPPNRALVLVAAISAIALSGLLFVAASKEPVVAWLRERLQVDWRTSPEVVYADPGFSTPGLYLANARYALAVFKESPLAGIGVGQFAAVGQVRGVQLGFSTDLTKDGPWVGLTGFLAEFGLVGVFLFGMLIREIARRQSSDLAEHDPDRFIAILLIFAIIAKETYSGFYIHFSTWFPLALAGLLRLQRVKPLIHLESASAAGSRE